MTIRIYRDRIELGDFVLRETADGASFDGEVAAQQFLGNAFQGTVAGFTAGGTPPPGPVGSNTIDKFPFSSDSNATDVGDLPTVRVRQAGQSSQTHGYASGGEPAPLVNTIEKFPFASNGNGTDVGDLTQGRAEGPAGQSSPSFGYNTGGGYPGPAANVIDKFPFATDTNATDVGDLTQGRTSRPAGQTSASSGYTSGGSIAPSPTPQVNTIDKFPFSTDTNATDVGDLTITKIGVAGQSSTTHGYSSGGTQPPPSTNTIEKFPFSTDSNSTDVGDLTQNKEGITGQSSTSFGYNSGGATAGSFENVIEKFPFSTDSNSTDVGDLTLARHRAAGTQD